MLIILIRTQYFIAKPVYSIVVSLETNILHYLTILIMFLIKLYLILWFSLFYI
jgi:hypothetical protein